MPHPRSSTTQHAPPRRPDADGTIYAGIHLHVTDSTGDGLLLEATADGGFAVYNTTVLTNEPAFPDMLTWAEAYGAYNFSAVPGIAGARAAKACSALQSSVLWGEGVPL